LTNARVPTTEIALYRDVIVAHNRHLTREIDDRADRGKVAAGSGFGRSLLFFEHPKKRYI
jgi:hypothetical protein